MANYFRKYFISILTILLLTIVIMALSPFHHPSEARYAAISMRMALTGNYLMPFFDPITPFFSKPPLSFWASAVFFKIFGFNEFAGRLPHFLALIAICFLVYRFTQKIYDSTTAMVATLLLSSSALFFSIHSIMTEAFLLLGMTISSLSFFLQIRSNKPKIIDGYLFFLGCIIAVLSKGPVGIIMLCFPIFVYLLITGEWKALFKKFPIIVGSLAFLIIAAPWFIIANKYYPGFLRYFIIGENFKRFAVSGWSGDRYGNAHQVPFASIWAFFLLTTLPVSLLLFIKPKQIWRTAIYNIRGVKNNKNLAFLFLSLSFLLPMIVLTFMKNMIMTYAVYSLVPFMIIMAIIIVEKRWYNFPLFIGYFSIAIYLSVIAILIVNPEKLIKKINYQDYLVKQIPESDYQLFYIGKNYGLYTLYWHSKDSLKIINKRNYIEKEKLFDSKTYIISDEGQYKAMPTTFQEKLEAVKCLEKRKTCLYKPKTAA